MNEGIRRAPAIIISWCANKKRNKTEKPRKAQMRFRHLRKK